MRCTLLCCLLGLAACGDPGLRDRSLMAREGPVLLRASRRAVADPLEAGAVSLVGDALARLYPDDAEMIVRFADVGTLTRETRPELDRLQSVMPRLRIPPDDPATLLRRALKLPTTVVIDPGQPFALVATPRGWLGIVPTRDSQDAPRRMKQIDPVYCAVGDAAVLAGYGAGFASGTYLPGDVSIVAGPSAYEQLGTRLTTMTKTFGFDFSFLDACFADLPKDLGRLDLALTLRDGHMQADVRAEGRDGTPTAHFLRRMQPSKPLLARFLPDDATIYATVHGPLEDAHALTLNMLHGRSGRQPQLPPHIASPLTSFLRGFGEHAAMALTLDDDGAGDLLLLTHVDDGQMARYFLDSAAREDLLDLIAGADGQLSWRNHAFAHAKVTVSSITGFVSRRRSMDWQSSGDVWLSTLGKMLRGPAVVYIAIVDKTMVVCIGARARRRMEAVIDRLHSSPRGTNGFTRAMVGLSPEFVAGLRVDLAQLLMGTREAAPYWHPATAKLRSFDAPNALPATVAITTERNALRITLHLPAPGAAALANRIRRRLAAD